jgi:hypothetical protein
VALERTSGVEEAAWGVSVSLGITMRVSVGLNGVSLEGMGVELGAGRVEVALEGAGGLVPILDSTTERR